jgi:hypothetical protein
MLCYATYLAEMAPKDSSQDGMLEALLWLTPAAKDLLRTVSKALRGAVPCPTSELANALSEADVSEGPLADQSVRNALVVELKALGCEVSDKTAPTIVDALGKVLMKDIDSIKKKASGVKSKLPKQKQGEPMAGYQALAPLQSPPSEALGKDWLIWHSSANAHDGKVVGAPPDVVFTDRAALAACSPKGPAGEYAVSMHVLENIADYIKWELSLEGSKAPKAGTQVLCPFDDKMVTEVAIRRTLTNVLPPDVAISVLSEAGGNTTNIPKALQKLAADARKQAVIPMYAAPPAPKEPKGAKEPKEKEQKDKKGKKGEDAAAPASTGATATVLSGGEPGSFNALHTATATQELQWHLLAYRLDPGTTLSRTSGATSGGGAKAAGGSAGAASNTPKPAGFAGTWSVGQVGTVPPGHTVVSWSSKTDGSKAFQNIWTTSSSTPPGHTATSWGKATSSVPIPTAPIPAKPAKAGAAQAPAKAAAPPTPAKAAAPAAPAGIVDETAIKAVGDEIRVLKEKLKAEGLSGKKINDHPDITRLVKQLTELKQGGAVQASPPARKN